MFKLCFARMFLRVLACLIIYLCAFRIARRLHACKHFLPLSPSFYIMHNLHYSCLCTFQRKKAPFSTCCSRRFPAAPTSDSKSPEIQCLCGSQRFGLSGCLRVSSHKFLYFFSEVSHNLSQKTNLGHSYFFPLFDGIVSGKEGVPHSSDCSTLICFYSAGA